MNDLFFGGGAALFTAAAVLGTIVFGFRMAMMLIGFDGDVDGDVAFDGADSGDAFTILSLQSIAALLMGFGWAGLAALKGSGWPWIISLGAGIVGGIGMAWFSAKMMQLMYRMQSSGNLGIEQALYLEGVVYATVPAQRAGKGQIRLVIDDHERFFYAVTDGPDIESRVPIRVTEVNQDNTVTVARADPLNALPTE